MRTLVSAILALCLLSVCLAVPASAASFTVKTVPWVATNALIPHDTYASKSVTLKGECASCTAAGTYNWSWSFGDGTPVATGSFSAGAVNRYYIEAAHTYSGAVGTIYTARLTIQNMTSGEIDDEPYYVQMRANTLDVRVNIAIDEGLWYLHKAMTRSGNDGNWDSMSGYYSVGPSNVNAFEASGHLETGPASNPYTETVARGLRGAIFARLATTAISTQNNGSGTFNPDKSSPPNGIGIGVNQSYPMYQTGMFVDALVATGTPGAVVPAGYGAMSGRTYGSIVQDMVDYYQYCQHDLGYTPAGGGWGYNCNTDYNDNSVSQWAAIALIPAERNFGAVIDPLVRSWNQVWLANDVDSSGRFGYNQSGYFPWGPYATTPSGMVQMVLDGIARGDVKWDAAERFICDNLKFGTGSATTNIRSYYYGMFSFVKSMRLYRDASLPNGITNMNCTSGTLDWYGDPGVGVATTLVSAQGSGGNWSGHYYDGNQNPYETAWAILMLSRTLFESGSPVAVGKATPNPSVAGQLITLSAVDSYHQDAARTIVSWDWDLDNNGTYETHGLTATISYPAVGLYHVGLKVTDNTPGTPKTATTIVDITVSTPPIAPTANAGGPYRFCPGQTWFLDASASVNPDEGQHQAGSFPGDTINWAGGFLWDLNGDNLFDNATGKTPNVTAFYTAAGPGSYIAQLKVTDTTASSYPASGQPNLSSVASAQVRVYANGDPACTCVSNLTARGKPGKMDLVWTPRAALPDHFNVYRANVSGGPYAFLGSVPGSAGVYADFTVGPTGTYYYIVRETQANGSETCQSNQAVGIIGSR